MSSSPSEVQETGRSETGPLNEWYATRLQISKRPHATGLVLLKLDGVAIWLVD
jgi:hypothetical protein